MHSKSIITSIDKDLVKLMLHHLMSWTKEHHFFLKIFKCSPRKSLFSVSMLSSQIPTTVYSYQHY